MTRTLLIVDARVLTPQRDGGSFRMAGLVRVFQRLGFDVHFVPSFRESFPPFDATLAADTAALADVGVTLAQEPTVDAHLRAHGHRYDVVLITGTFVASRHLGAVRRLAPGAVVIFDTIDLHFMREYRAARLSGSAARVQAALKIKAVELAIARAADATLVVSDRERQLLADQTPSIRSWVVPISMDQPGLSEHACMPDNREGLLFLGAFSFDPNPDAVLFFVRDILPLVRARLPNLGLRIVGSDPTPDVLALSDPGVEVSGFIPELDSAFRRARVFVAPLRYGAGVKTKVLQSMAHGLPVVASSIAAEGIEARDGHDLLVADRPDAWVTHIASLCESDALWQQLSDRGRALVARRYSLRATEGAVNALIEEVMPRRKVAHSVHS